MLTQGNNINLNAGSNLIGQVDNPTSTYQTFNTGLAASGTVFATYTNLGSQRFGAIFFSNTGSGGTMRVEISFDNTTWMAAVLQQTAATTTPIAGETSIPSTASVNRVFPTYGAPFVRLIAVQAFTTAAVGGITFSNIPFPNNIPNIISANPSSSFGESNFYNVVTTASTNAVNIKNTSVHISNIIVYSPSIMFLKLYNSGAAPVVGTTTIAGIIPMTSQVTNINLGSYGWRFTAGLSIATTLNAAITDTTAGVAGATISLAYT